MNDTMKRFHDPMPVHSVPLPLGGYLARVRDACGGQIPNRATPAAAALLTWSVFGVTDDERDAFDRAARQWTLFAALMTVGDVTRSIALREPLFPRRDA